MFTLVQARATGFDVHGVGFSRWARAAASERVGLDASASPNGAPCNRPQQASALTMFQITEHSPGHLCTVVATAETRVRGSITRISELFESLDRPPSGVLIWN